MSALDGLLWLLVVSVPFLALQRALHREIQAVLLIVTRHAGVTMALFSLIFFPGVLLHELSHYLMARLLGVRTGQFSLWPSALPDGRLQLGYVETARSDVVRDALIGLAPLITGGLLVAYVAVFPMGLLSLWDALRAGAIERFWAGVARLPQTQDFPIWFYLAFTVSSTMLPSQADRHAWLPLGLWLGGLVALAVLAGAGPWLLAHLAPPLNAFLRSVAMVFGVSALLHAALALPAALLHRVLTRLTGLDVQ